MSTHKNKESVVMVIVERSIIQIENIENMWPNSILFSWAEEAGT